MSGIEQCIKAKIEAIGTPLKDWDINIYRGILTGYNEAFIIDGKKRQELIDKDPKSDEIIRPLLRGRDIKRYSYEFADLHLITTFPSLRVDIERYPAIKQHLMSFGYDRLKQNGDKGARKKTNNQWFETQDSINYWEDFYRQKIVWGEISDNANFALDDNDKYFVNNKCYLLTGPKLEYLVSFLNSRLAEYLFSKIATTTGVGTLQWSKFTIEQLPVPVIEEGPEQEFIQLLPQLIEGSIDKTKIDTLVYEVCGLTVEEIKFIEAQ
ncbi:TaqI-like C-terminal specificity domain-containing protein [Parapedobacter sp. DT-150]|uniref:TaqI-like C-terminal specificity domain-containing protein n=1 Tax=Parapedobacter sp. DT-150 TaxID=3396162 RepID=UPI003F1E38E5